MHFPHKIECNLLQYTTKNISSIHIPVQNEYTIKNLIFSILIFDINVAILYAT